MKRLLAALISVTLLTGCTEKTSAPAQSTSAPESIVRTDMFTDSVQTDAYDPFAQNIGESEERLGAFSFGVEWKEGKELVLDYAPTVTFPYYVENSAGQTDFGLLIFVNGFRQPYRTDTEQDTQDMHIFTVAQDERIQPIISFEPIIGKKGETISVEIISMFHPRFVLTDQTTYSALGYNHRILSMYPSELTVTQETALTEPAVCSQYAEIPITKELREEYADKDGNRLDHTIYLEALKNDTLITPKNQKEAGGIPKAAFSPDDTVTLCMYGGGKSCKYRISMYLNHELVSGVFDGCDYIDMTPSADTMCKKEIDLRKLSLSHNAYSHFYFIAVPFYTDRNYQERYTVKSESMVIIL